MEFNKLELDIMRDNAVAELECSYCGDLDDIDVANEPANKFDIEEDQVMNLQSIVKKIDGE